MMLGIKREKEKEYHRWPKFLVQTAKKILIYLWFIDSGSDLQKQFWPEAVKQTTTTKKKTSISIVSTFHANTFSPARKLCNKHKIAKTL